MIARIRRYLACKRLEADVRRRKQTAAPYLKRRAAALKGAGVEIQWINDGNFCVRRRHALDGEST